MTGNKRLNFIQTVCLITEALVYVFKSLYGVILVTIKALEFFKTFYDVNKKINMNLFVLLT